MTNCFATGGSHAVVFVEEVTYGVTPTVDNSDNLLKRFRSTNSDLNVVRDNFQSEELRGDQQLSDLRLGTFQVEGSLGYELSFYSQRDFVRGAIGGEWYPSSGVPGDALPSDTATDVSTTTNSFDSAATIDWTVNFVAGDVVEVKGFTTAIKDSTNNGIYKVTAVTTSSLTIDGTLVVGIAGDTVIATKINDSKIRAGLGQPSFTVERQYNDISQYQDLVGCTIDQWQMTVTPNGIVAGSFAVLGSTIKGSVSGGTQLEQVPISTEIFEEGSVFSPMDSFNGTMYEGGIQIATVTSVEFSLTRSMENTFVIGSQETVCVVPGRNIITGTAQIYFSDEVMYNKFLAEEESSMEFSLQDGDSSVSGSTVTTFTIDIPRLKYTTANIPVSSEQGITLSMDFTSLLDIGTSSNIEVTLDSILIP